MTAEEFTIKTGRAPEQDDLERVNCDWRQTNGHSSCGWCAKHDQPRFQCAASCWRTEMMQEINNIAHDGTR